MPFLLKIICFLLALLPLSALGHDLYIAYDSGNDFSFSAFGWLLKTYEPSLHTQLIMTFGKETYVSDIAPLLEYRAFPTLVGLVAVIYGVLIALWLLNVWPFKNSFVIGSGFARYGSESSGNTKFNYKRK